MSFIRIEPSRQDYTHTVGTDRWHCTVSVVGTIPTSDVQTLYHLNRTVNGPARPGTATPHAPRAHGAAGSASRDLVLDFRVPYRVRRYSVSSVLTFTRLYKYMMYNYVLAIGFLSTASTFQSKHSLLIPISNIA